MAYIGIVTTIPLGISKPLIVTSLLLSLSILSLKIFFKKIDRGIPTADDHPTEMDFNSDFKKKSGIEYICRQRRISSENILKQ